MVVFNSVVVVVDADAAAAFVSSNSINVSVVSIILFVARLSSTLPFDGNEKNDMTSCRRLENGFFCSFDSSMVCAAAAVVVVVLAVTLVVCTWLLFHSILFTSMAMLFELSSSDIDSEPFKNGLVQDFGPLLIFATTSDRLICVTPQLAGLEYCRFVVGRGMTVLLSFNLV